MCSPGGNRCFSKQAGKEKKKKSPYFLEKEKRRFSQGSRSSKPLFLFLIALTVNLSRPLLEKAGSKGPQEALVLWWRCQWEGVTSGKICNGSEKHGSSIFRISAKCSALILAGGSSANHFAKFNFLLVYVVGIIIFSTRFENSQPVVCTICLSGYSIT